MKLLGVEPPSVADVHNLPEVIQIHQTLLGGGVLIVDNMIWHGQVFDPKDKSADTEGVREFTRLITNDPGWIASLLPVQDGLLVAYKK